MDEHVAYFGNRAENRIGWARAIVVTGAEKHKQHMPEGENLISVGSIKFVDSRASNSQFDSLVQRVRGVTTLYKS